VADFTCTPARPCVVCAEAGEGSDTCVAKAFAAGVEHGRDVERAHHMGAQAREYLDRIALKGFIPVEEAKAIFERDAAGVIHAELPLVDVVAELEAMRESNKRKGANVIRTAVPPLTPKPPRPCHTCGRLNCTPQNHAGWSPDDEGHG
jgi:hypothetical protein